jgi:hypothetical protein
LTGGDCTTECIVERIAPSADFRFALAVLCEDFVDMDEFLSVRAL